MISETIPNMDLDSGKNKENQVKLVFGEEKQFIFDSDGSDKKPSNTEKTFPCLLCNKSFNQKHSLARHLKSHKTTEGHECSKCNKKFAAIRDLKKHIDIVHLNKAEDYKKECPICFTRVQQLKTHIRFIHRNEAKSSDFNCVCPQCDKTFSNDYKVKRHIETVHEGVKNWQCTICPKRFYEKKDLGRHVKGVHMGQKVDTWRSKKKGNKKSKSQGQVVVTKNFLSTVDISREKDQITLPINVLDEEGDDKSEDEDDIAPGTDELGREDISNDPEEDKEVDEEGSDSEEMEISEVDPVYNEELDCRFQVCKQRVDEEGNLVLEIEEKVDSNSVSKGKEDDQEESNKMITLRWGQGNTEDEVKDMTDDPKMVVSKVTSKVIDLNIKLEDIIDEASNMANDDFVLPEVVGDLPDWFLNTSSELEFLKLNPTTSEVSDKTLETPSKEPINPDDPTKTAFRCGACGKMFISLEFLKSHIEKTHILQKSGMESETISETVPGENLKPAKKESSPKPAKDETLVCTIDGCEKSFTGKGRKMQYKRHVERVHLSVKNKQCPKCDLKFYEKRDLTRHIEAIHLGIRTICPEAGCSKPVVRLDQHLKMSHSSGDKSNNKVDKSSKCVECGATFSRIYDMIRHRENVHRGMKNFACDKCDRRFSDKRDLKRHYDAVHLNIKQKKTYTCPICQKIFKFKKLLDVHRFTEHEGDTVSKLSSKESPQMPVVKLKESGTVLVTVNNIPNVGEESITASTVVPDTTEGVVEIDGQLFIVQQTEAGISLLPVIRTREDTIELAVEGFAIEHK